MPFSLTQIQVLELELHLGPAQGLPCLLLELQDCVPGWVLVVEVTEEAEAEVVVVEAAVAAAVEEEVAAGAAAAVAAAV